MILEDVERGRFRYVNIPSPSRLRSSEDGLWKRVDFLITLQSVLNKMRSVL